MRHGQGLVLGTPDVVDAIRYDLDVCTPACITYNSYLEKIRI